MRFMEACEGWNAGRLSQAEAASLLGMSERNFHRYLSRFVEEGLEAVLERKAKETSPRVIKFDGRFEARLILKCMKGVCDGRFDYFRTRSWNSG